LQTLAPVIYDSIAAMTLRADQDIVNVDISEQMPKLNIDPEKIQQAMLNILSNALKYSPNGGEVDVRAFERTRAHGTQACISVCDHGIGMKPEQLARVFERFFRADPSGNIPGTGLGMSLVKEIMEIHGGGVEVESTFGVGTTVTLWLPVAEQEISAPDQA
jgi:signal transduction histidine kinase